jgi:hypothetical protein
MFGTPRAVMLMYDADATIQDHIVDKIEDALGEFMSFGDCCG